MDQQSPTARITELLLKHINRTLNPEDQRALDAWIGVSVHKKEFVAGLHAEADLERDQLAFESILSNEDVQWGKMVSSMYASPRAFYESPLFRIAAAVIILLGFVTVGWMLGYKPGGSSLQVVKQDVAPGGNKAVLTLADGSKLVLDEAANGTLTQQGAMQVIKLADGQLSYAALNDKESDDVMFNTMSTPRGGQYMLTLPDGTKVWLNAASSITYPVHFTGKERKVTVKGEAYFEVVKNAAMPFFVNVNGSTVQVLGTSFNINAYDDEDELKTTLLEGSVKIITKGGNGILLPGQQAVMTTGTEKFTINKDADTKRVVAWKNGKFSFEKAGINEIMRQLARWYDVEVAYETPVHGGFYATIDRSENISKILNLLSLTGKVRFIIKDKRIVVEKPID